jgi:hypothetical protein
MADMLKTLAAILAHRQTDCVENEDKQLDFPWRGLCACDADDGKPNFIAPELQRSSSSAHLPFSQHPEISATTCLGMPR